MRTVALAVVFSTMFAAHAARANDFAASDDDKIITSTSPVKDDNVTATSPVKDEGESAATAPSLRLPQPRSGSFAGASLLRSMHVSLGALQVYDVYSTQKAMRHGAVERNPLLQNTVANRAAFVGLKIAMTVGPIYEAEKLWRNHHRIGAIALMAASNGIMMGVAAHNASVIRQAQTLQTAR
jgi:hypothetical protein